MKEVEKEHHLFIIWSKGLNKENEIIEDLQRYFIILKKVYVTWSNQNFSNNLSRFYGQKLPSSSEKQKHCGTGTFLVLVVEDEKPKYRDIDIGNGRGNVIVNWNIYSKKKLYRKWTGGGHKIHATNDTLEFKHDAFLLFKTNNISDITSKINTNYNEDLAGSEAWDNLKQLQSAIKLHNKYVVLRGDFDENLLAGTEDLDILVEDITESRYLLNAVNKGKKYSSNRHTTYVQGNVIHIDINVVGDNNFCENWQKLMISSSVEKNSINILNEINQKFSDIYHSLYHKGNVNIPCNEVTKLSDYMEVNGFSIVEADDMTVGFYGSNDVILNKSYKRKVFELYIKIRSRLGHVKQAICKDKM